MKFPSGPLPGLVPADLSGGVPDPRGTQARRHPLTSIPCPAPSRQQQCRHSGEVDHRDWFEQWLHLPHGIPSHDAFGQVFVLLDPELLEAGFAHWVQAPHGLAASRVAALDG